MKIRSYAPAIIILSLIILLIIAAILYFGAGYRPVPADRNIKQAVEAEEPGDRRIIISLTESGFIYGGSLRCEDEFRAYTDDEGFAYFSLSDLAAMYGGSVSRAYGLPVYRITDRSGGRAYVLAGTNLAVIGNEVIRAAHRITEDGGACLADTALAARLLNLRYSADYEHGLIKLNSTAVTEQDISAAEAVWGCSAQEYDPVVATAAEYLGLSYREAVTAAAEGKLYYSNDAGELFCARLNAFGRAVVSMAAESGIYEPDRYFIAGLGGDRSLLYTVNNGSLTEAAPIPDVLREEVINKNKETYWSFKVQDDISDVDRTAVLEELRHAIASGSMAAPQYTAPPVEGCDWHSLWEAAEPGDVILCRRADNVEYGFNNHSAVVLEKLPDDVLHIVHARSAEYGVGAENGDLDFLTEERMIDNDYWEKTSIITLYTYPGITDKQRGIISEKGGKMFNSYEFGYYGFTGKRQVTCAELVCRLYEEGGIQIGPSESEARAAMLSGRLDEAVFLPDDIMMGDFRIRAVFLSDKDNI